MAQSWVNQSTCADVTEQLFSLRGRSRPAPVCVLAPGGATAPPSPGSPPSNHLRQETEEGTESIFTEKALHHNKCVCNLRVLDIPWP